MKAVQKRFNRRSMGFALLAGILLGASSAWSQCYVVTKKGQRIEGSRIRAKSSGEILLTTANGVLPFPRGSYMEAVTPEPKEYQQAVDKARSGDYDGSISLLKGIIREYQFLEWDNKARDAIAKMYVQKGDFDNARRAYEEVFEQNPELKDDPEYGWSYRETLLKSGKTAQLLPELEQIIKTGPREDAAKAQILRGDIAMEKGDVEPAVLDYMRTMVFFKDIKDVQPEAIYKAAAGLEKMRDNRSGALYQQVVEEYPSSPYATSAKSKM
ncbi:MAG: tetratricopeptide repeat protein [Spartobacteria bacterium]|nr:tetratricopeptide repeat protein [Spartobacteria bacterium]